MPTGKLRLPRAAPACAAAARSPLIAHRREPHAGKRGRKRLQVAEDRAGTSPRRRTARAPPVPVRRAGTRSAAAARAPGRPARARPRRRWHGWRCPRRRSRLPPRAAPRTARSRCPGSMPLSPRLLGHQRVDRDQREDDAAPGCPRSDRSAPARRRLRPAHGPTRPRGPRDPPHRRAVASAWPTRGACASRRRRRRAGQRPPRSGRGAS